MCGISGIIQSKVNNSKIASGTDFLDLLNHRGPDSAGTWQDSFKGFDIIMNHNRLAILDLSENANQPMFSNDGNLVLCFNGEIYNFKEIKQEISAFIDYNWKTESDTEVVLKSFELWGEQCFEKFNGMFALSIFDKQKGTITLARDRFGIKPLYYLLNEKDFAFSSELKPLFSVLKEKQISPEGLTSYLTMRGAIAPYSLIKDIYKLDKGSILKIKLDPDNNIISSEILQFHTQEYPRIFNNSDFTEQIDELENKLKSSIKSQWISDVPVCLFLSGGIDSSLIAAISSKFYPDSKVTAFCIGLEGNTEDESRYAKLVAEKYNIDLHVLNFSENPLTKIDDWLYFNDDLLSDPAAFALFYLSKEISKRGFKVVLSGEGADELFGGYKGYLDSKKIKLAPLNDLLSVTFKLLFKWSPRRLFENLFIKYRNKSIYWGAANLYNELSLSKLLIDKKGYKWLDSKFVKFYRGGNDNLLNQKLYFDLHFRLPNDLLMRTDRATMASSLEARVPFLDNDLVDFAVGLPQESKFGVKLNQTKVVLKRVASRYFDESFVYRIKQGFPIPVSDWLRDEKIYTEMNRFINEGKVQHLNYGYVEYMLNQHNKQKQDFGDRLFALYMLEKYVRYWSIV